MAEDPVIDEQDFALPVKACLEDSRQVPLTAAEQKLVGQVLDSQFQILELIGRGGVSVVYKARHLLLKKEVAIKTLHTHLASDQKSVLRFQQEARAAIQLDHPNIVKEYGFGVTDDGPYIVLDYLDGISLSEVLKSKGALSPQDALNIFIQCCNALEHAHSKNVIHRDLKPSNIMLLEQEGQPFFVKIVDFGIAKLIALEGEEAQQLTQTGEIFGSPSYMSPEQCVGAKVDRRSDIYALACVLYEALTTAPPFQAKNVYGIIHKHITDMPSPLCISGAEAALVQRLDGIIFKALAKEPSQRYQSMRELEQDLCSVRDDLEFGKSGSKLLIKFASGQRYIKRLLKTRTKAQLAALFLLPILGLGVSFFFSQFSWFFEPHKFGIYSVSWIDELERRPKLALSTEEKQRRLDAGETVAQLEPLLWGGDSAKMLELWRTSAEESRLLGAESRELEARKKIIGIMEKLGTTDDTLFAAACEELVRCTMSRGKMSESEMQTAEGYMLKALEIRSRVIGMSSVKTYMRLAELYVRMRDYTKAKQFYDLAIVYCQKRDLLHSMDYAACLAGLADVYRLKGDGTDNAEARLALLKQADAQYKSASQNLEGSTSYLAARFSNQICLYRAYVNQVLGLYAESRRLYAESMPYAQKLLSSRPHEYQQLLDDYAYTAFQSGDLLKALELRKEQ